GTSRDDCLQPRHRVGARAGSLSTTRRISAAALHTKRARARASAAESISNSQTSRGGIVSVQAARLRGTSLACGRRSHGLARRPLRMLINRTEMGGRSMRSSKSLVVSLAVLAAIAFLAAEAFAKCEPEKAASKYPSVASKKIKVAVDPESPPYTFRDPKNFENIIGFDA